MGGVIDTVKASVADIVNAIDTEVGVGNYRLGLVISDEYDGAGLPTYNGSAGYTSLPGSQRDVNSGIGHTQYNTAMELFSDNNETTFTTQLNLLNTGPFPLGGGAGTPEPLDMALDFVVNNDFLNSFRINVAKYVLIFTDAPPGGDDDVYNGTDDIKIATLTTDCLDAGVKVFIIGGGATQTVWQDLATNTGGTFNTSFDSKVIISEIIASCQELEAPVADAGVDQVIQLPTNSVNLDGSASFDLDGVISTYLWEQTTALPGVITTPNNVTTSVTGLATGNYIFKLTVTDNDALVDTDSMVVQVDTASSITLTSVSISSTWQASSVVKTGAALTWDIIGGITDNQVGDNPIFDFSSNIGNANVTVYPAIDITTFSVPSLDITDIDISDATNLATFTCTANSLNTLDVTSNTLLGTFDCSSNNLNTLDVTQNTGLTLLGCGANNLAALDVTQNITLGVLGCENNILNSIDLTQNTVLTVFNASNNNFATLDLTQNTIIEEVRISGNSVPTIDLTQNTALRVLVMNNNGTTSFDLSQNLLLESLTASVNSLNAIDITLNTALQTLNVLSNTISTIDVSNNVALVNLDVQNNSLTNLDITNNILLTNVSCDGNALVAGDINNIIIQLDTNGLNNGLLNIPLGRTVASDAAKTSLQGKGWTVTEI
jgi:hypothetical protein